MDGNKTMAGILHVQQQSHEHQTSDESLYLAQMLQLNLERVFETIQRSQQATSTSTLSYVLLMPHKRAFIAEVSLRRMKQAIDDGMDIVLPNNLTSFSLTEIPHTLRAYQTIEQRILKDDRPPTNHSAKAVQMALFRADVWNMLVETIGCNIMTISISQLLSEPFRNCFTGVYYTFDDYYGSVRDDILQFLPPKVDDVLEIGCARGKTGDLIQKTLNCHVTGVELNSIIAHEAQQRLHRVITGDILTVELDETYDVIIATEVIEHITDPNAFIQRLLTLLKPNGRIILTTPNTGHYSIVEDLIAGRWDYIPQGLLCYTHIRFFTKSSLEDWIQSWGIRNYQIIPQMLELPERIKTLPPNLDPDWESLSTLGFYIILNP